ncbi:hypothetical protein [Rhizobium sp. RCC_161_2]|uniref:hypothetical protein n=1 Tax=Rhizobium sp. RCC_161_2 TaxID=3239219 RepID=UPI003525E3AC
MDDERPVCSGLFVYGLLVACFAEAERAIFVLIAFIVLKEKPPRLPAAVSWKEAPG